jgi:hypothetical protein
MTGNSVGRARRATTVPFARLVPNEKTIAAMREVNVGRLPRFKNTKDLLRELNEGD